MALIMITAAAPVWSQSQYVEGLRSEIKQRLVNNVLGKAASNGMAKTRRQAAEISADGKWADIDYADKSPSNWQLAKHLERAALVAAAEPESDAPIRALRQWFKGDYQNSNWWYAQIGVPVRLLDLAYLLDDRLPATLRDTLDQALDVFQPDSYAARPGGDRINVLSNCAKVMIWRGDTDGLADMFNLIEREAGYASLEDVMYDARGNLENRISYRPAGRGVQWDGTFNHRGDRVDDSLTYGAELPDYYYYWDRRLKGTPWEFGDSSRRFIDDYVNQTMRWHMIRDRYTEPAAYNRELAKPVTAPADRKFGDGVPMLGARYFPQATYFAFKRPRYETAVRMHSLRNANQEAAHNGEGIRNHYRGDGACHLSVTGEEYVNIWPLFDFRKVPGVTSPLTPYTEMNEKTVQIMDSPIEFAGAVTDSVYGAAAIDFSTSRSDLTARKSWFFFDEGYVCLGSGINSTSGDTIVTTVEQCLTPDASVNRKGAWLINNGNSYKIIKGTPKVSAEMRTGTWKNCVANASYMNDEVTDRVFELTIEHGRNPKDASYAYAVAPGAAAPDDWFRILRQDDKVHAVASKDGSIVYVVFFEPSAVDTPQGKINVARPCMVMARNGEYWFSDPTHRLDRIPVKITRDGNVINKNVTLATWRGAGKSVKL